MEKALKFLLQKPGWRKTSATILADKIDCPVSEVREALKYLHKSKITAYDEFLEENGIDYRSVKAAWIKSQGNREKIDFSILTRNEIDYSESIKEVFENITYKLPEIARDQIGKKVAVVNLFDAHIDKISYVSQTGEATTMEDNASVFMAAFERILKQLRMHRPSKIIFPVGSDFWQVNGSNLTTKRGTPQYDQVHTDSQAAFRLGLQLIRMCIEKLHAIAPVVVVPIKGNHDEDRVMYLTECLLLAFNHSVDIDIVDNTLQRNYIKYGKTLFGFAHGDKEKKMVDKLPMLMATEQKKHWAEIDRGIFFLGDIHHEKRTLGYKTMDFMNVQVNFLRAVSSTDKWHYEHGWIGTPKTAYLFIYDEDGKEDLEFKVNI
jgi:hypothetical protein